jgi:hypothetical protein
VLRYCFNPVARWHIFLVYRRFVECCLLFLPALCALCSDHCLVGPRPVLNVDCWPRARTAFHPTRHTVQIEILGLRDMQASALLGLLAMRRPKIAFEIGGVQAVLNVAPSFAANGNFNFGDEYLPMLRYLVSDHFTGQQSFDSHQGKKPVFFPNRVSALFSIVLCVKHARKCIFNHLFFNHQFFVAFFRFIHPSDRAPFPQRGDQAAQRAALSRVDQRQRHARRV